MTNLSTLFPAVNTFTGDAGAYDLRTGKKAWVDGAELTGTGYFPALMEFDGSTGYYSKAGFNPSSNALTAVGRFRHSAFGGGGVAGILSQSLYGIWIRAYSSDHATSERQNKISFLVYDATWTNLCHLLCDVDIADDEIHSFLFAFDATTGTAVLKIDGSDVDDLGFTNRTLTTGTIGSPAGTFHVGAEATPNNFYSGQLGFIGFTYLYLTDWSDFFHPDGSPKELDTSTWTEWGGVQPALFHESAKMDENKGSAGNMTKNGSIILAPASSWS